MSSKFFGLIVSAVALCSMASAQVHAPAMNPDGSWNKVQGIGIDQKLDSQVPLDATFTDSQGRKVQLSQYFGKKPVILNLVYYGCKGMCVLTMSGLAESFAKMTQPGPTHDVIGKDVDIITLSIDPKETPALAASTKAKVMEALNAPTKCPEAIGGWHFLTGDLDNINKVATAVGFNFVYDPKHDLINHPAGVMVLTPSGRVSKYFYGTGYPEVPLHNALALAGDQKIGTKSQVFLLGCLCEDPLTGKMSLNVWRTLQVMCGITVLSLFGGITLMSIGKRAKARGGSA